MCIASLWNKFPPCIVCGTDLVLFKTAMEERGESNCQQLSDVHAVLEHYVHVVIVILQRLTNHSSRDAFGAVNRPSKTHKGVSLSHCDTAFGFQKRRIYVAGSVRASCYGSWSDTTTTSCTASARLLLCCTAAIPIA